ncbi:hypothetical protein EJ04DRAFT_522747 [Polyplosphaeria fusca]|uniref:USP domain-containing protein n=1 Tax=Polyplosphaeria fusca TaxID=682080 RepID=A0A9P4R336_9PLEO|nr:hypothetical protein EJ04DRAFT_522747 [Polyplosphaeria fusca]
MSASSNDVEQDSPDLNSSIDSAFKEIKLLKEKKRQMRRAVIAALRQVEDFDKDCNDKTQGIEATLKYAQTRIKDLDDQNAAIIKENEKVKRTAKRFKLERDAAEQKLAKLKESGEANRITKTQSDLKDATARILDLEGQLKTANHGNATRDKFLRDAKDTINNRNTKIVELQKKINASKIKEGEMEDSVPAIEDLPTPVSSSNVADPTNSSLDHSSLAVTPPLPGATENISELVAGRVKKPAQAPSTQDRDSSVWARRSGASAAPCRTSQDSPERDSPSLKRKARDESLSRGTNLKKAKPNVKESLALAASSTDSAQPPMIPQKTAAAKLRTKEKSQRRQQEINDVPTVMRRHFQAHPLSQPRALHTRSGLRFANAILQALAVTVEPLAIYKSFEGHRVDRNLAKFKNINEEIAHDFIRLIGELQLDSNQPYSTERFLEKFMSQIDSVFNGQQEASAVYFLKTVLKINNCQSIRDMFQVLPSTLGDCVCQRGYDHTPDSNKAWTWALDRPKCVPTREGTMVMPKSTSVETLVNEKTSDRWLVTCPQCNRKCKYYHAGLKIAPEVLTFEFERDGRNGVITNELRYGIHLPPVLDATAEVRAEDGFTNMYELVAVVKHSGKSLNDPNGEYTAFVKTENDIWWKCGARSYTIEEGPKGLAIETRITSDKLCAEETSANDRAVHGVSTHRSRGRKHNLHVPSSSEFTIIFRLHHHLQASPSFPSQQMRHHNPHFSRPYRSHSAPHSPSHSEIGKRIPQHLEPLSRSGLTWNRNGRPALFLE